MKVFITGASSGLGAALALHYAARPEEMMLGLAGRDAARLAAVAESVSALPNAIARSYIVEVTDTAALAAAATDFIARHGAPDLVIANAGVSTGTDCDRAEDIAVLSQLLAINVTGMAATLQPFIASMRGAGRGTLVGIASVAGIRGLPGQSAYSASKAAAINWLEALRVELAGSGISVVAICPGFIATPMTGVNPFPMPFILSADEAARRIARAIDRKTGRVIVPWQMRLVMGMTRFVPEWLYDAFMRRQKRKPRVLQEGDARGGSEPVPK